MQPPFSRAGAGRRAQRLRIDPLKAVGALVDELKPGQGSRERKTCRITRSAARPYAAGRSHGFPSGQAGASMRVAANVQKLLTLDPLAASPPQSRSIKKHGDLLASSLLALFVACARNDFIE